MRKITLKVFMMFSLLILVLGITACSRVKLSTAQFLETNATFGAYSLYDDNINPKTTYEYLNLHGSNDADTYMYRSIAGEEMYLFTTIDGYESTPVLSYFRVSENTDNGSLLGVRIGKQTIVYKNDVLGIKKTYSIYEYLKDQGFEINLDFPLKHSNNLGDARIVWFYLKKDNIFINYAVNVGAYLTLHAYEIGIIDSKVYDILTTYNDGYKLDIEANDHTVLSILNQNYAVGDYIQLQVSKSVVPGQTKLYINNVYIKDFDVNDYYYEADFYMFAEDIVIQIITE